MSTPTFLMIGATGRMGLALIRACSIHPSHPPIHAFCRTPSKLSPSDRALVASVQTGDACVAEDIEAALRATSANVVLVSLGVPNSTAPSEVRGNNAVALEQVLKKAEFAEVKVAVVSVVGSGGSVIDYGWGIGQLVSWILRDLLKDHDKQEEVLGGLGARCMIVRPMGLGDGKGGGVVAFEGRAPRLTVQREDLADWIVDRICKGDGWGEAVNVTGEKRAEKLGSWLDML